MARLPEYQGKAILAANGFKVPRGRMALSADEAVAAAKEVGGAYTNKHQLEHTGKDGKDLPATPTAQVTIFALPDNGRG